MRLNAPKKLTFWIAVLIAIVSLVVWLASTFGIITVCGVYTFFGMLIAFVLLLCGCVIKGL